MQKENERALSSQTRERPQPAACVRTKEKKNTRPAMEFDHELLLSLASGLGRWSDGPDGAPVYTKDDDCVGACCRAAPRERQTALFKTVRRRRGRSAPPLPLRRRQMGVEGLWLLACVAGWPC